MVPSLLIPASWARRSPIVDGTRRSYEQAAHGFLALQLLNDSGAPAVAYEEIGNDAGEVDHREGNEDAND